MKEIINSIPWSGVGFIFASALLIGFWTENRYLSFVYLLLAEIGLFILCFYICDKESNKK